MIGHYYLGSFIRFFYFFFCLKVLSKVIDRMIMKRDLVTYKETLVGHLKHDTPLHTPHLFGLTQQKLI